MEGVKATVWSYGGILFGGTIAGGPAGVVIGGSMGLFLYSVLDWCTNTRSSGGL